MCRALASLASRMSSRRIAPQPMTATSSLMRIFDKLMAWRATPSGSSNAPATGLIPSGSGTQDRAGCTICSRSAPWRGHSPRNCRFVQQVGVARLAALTFPTWDGWIDGYCLSDAEPVANTISHCRNSPGSLVSQDQRRFRYDVPNLSKQICMQVASTDTNSRHVQQQFARSGRFLGASSSLMSRAPWRYAAFTSTLIVQYLGINSLSLRLRGGKGWG